MSGTNFFQKWAKKRPHSNKRMRSKKPASTYSPALKREVPSAQVGLTSLFEMVRGGPNRHRHRKRCPSNPRWVMEDYPQEPGADVDTMF